MIKVDSQETSCIDPSLRAMSPMSTVSNESWEQLSVSCLTTTNSIVSREAETGLIEALRQPGLLKRVVAQPEDAILEDDASIALKSRVWERLTGMNVKFTLLLASNVLSFVVGVWLGRRNALSHSPLPGTLVISSM